MSTVLLDTVTAVATLALVPARAGSKGLPGKNLAEVGGRTLIARAVDVAQRCEVVDRVIVSSDGDDILAEANRTGAEAERRPQHLAADDSTIEDVVLDLLTRVSAVDIVVVLQPTSPLRLPSDIAACVAGLAEATTAATVTALSHPVEWTFRLGSGGRLEPILGWEGVSRRQERPPAYQLNGAVYAARVAHLQAGGRLVGPETVGVVMPAERSVDIDTRYDLELARHLARVGQTT
jgi:N-acylneuraminate cytidylyltransferase